jgi:hypothetical protein
LAKKRGQILNETLEATLSYFPKEKESHPFLAEVAEMIETFFLLDHCEEVDDLPDTPPPTTTTTPFRPSMPLGAATIETTPGKNTSLTSSTKRLGGSITGSIFKSQKKSSHRKSQSSVEGGYNLEDETTSLAILHYVNNVATPEKVKQQQPESEITSPSIIPFKLDEAAGKIGSLIQKAWSGDGDDVLEQPKKSLPFRLDTSRSSHQSARSLTSPVVPYTRKTRRSLSKRVLDDEELEDVGSEANLLLDDDRPPTELVPNYSRPVPNFQSPGTKLGDLLENNPTIFALIAAVVVSLLRHAANLSVTMDLDIQLLLIFASFCIGLHTPRPMIGGIDKTTGPPMAPLSPINTTIVRRSSNQRGGLKRKDQSGRLLLRKAMSVTTTPTANTPDGPHSNRSSNSYGFGGGVISTISFGANNDDDVEDEMNNDDDDDEEGILQVNRSPMPRFPEGATLGSHLNCWSEPVAKDFQVRGPKYLSDRKKVPSPGFVFPVRGVDLFLTDSCPENAGR